MTIKIVHKNTSESDFLTFGTYFKKYGKRHDKHLHYYNVGESIGEDVEYNLGVEITSSTANSISDNSFSFAIGYNSGQVTGNTVALLAADDVNTWVNENSNYFSPTIILIGDDSSTSLGDRILNTSNNIVTVTNTSTLENTDNVGNYFNALQYDMNEIMSLSTDQYVTDRFSWQYFELDSINKSLYNNKYICVARDPYQISNQLLTAGLTIEQAGNKVANIFENMYNASLLDNSLVIDIDDINNNANTVISNINTFVNNTVSVEYGLQAVDDNLTSEQRSTLQGIFNTNSLHFTALGYTI